MNVKRYYFHCPGMVYACDVYGRNKREARAAARSYLGVSRLPRGTAIWEA